MTSTGNTNSMKTEEGATFKSFPTNPQVVASNNHPQAETVLKFLLRDAPEEFSKLQTILADKALHMIDSNLKTLSFKVDPREVGIKNIVCHMPVGGHRLLRIYKVDTPTWTKVFTGDNYRVDTTRIAGEMGEKNVNLNPGDNLVIDLANEIHKLEDGRYLTNVTVTNISISSDTNLTFGPNKRGVSMPHLVAITANQDFMKDKFQIGDKKVPLEDISQAKEAINICKNSVMPLGVFREGFAKYKDYMNIKDGDKPLSSGVILCNELTKLIPELYGKMYVTTIDGSSEKYNGVAIKISHGSNLATDCDDKFEDWATNEKIWSVLLRYIGENICKVV